MRGSDSVSVKGWVCVYVRVNTSVDVSISVSVNARVRETSRSGYIAFCILFLVKVQ